jgi:glycosyltransferase involved in cell wall biosynthesis
MSHLTVVIPVYNEGENLREWYRTAQPYLPPKSVIRVVYDFEEDNTLPVARELISEGAPVELLKNEAKGVLGALVTGLRSVGEGPALVSMADLSDDFSIIPNMLAAYERGAKVVVASRYMAGGRQIGGPWLKSQLSRWGGVSLHYLAGFPSHDATNSFRLYDGGMVAKMDFESTGGFEIGFEITLKAWMAGEPVVEIPTTWRDRVRGESRFNLRKWLPLYARLWTRALTFGLSRHLRSVASTPLGS